MADDPHQSEQDDWRVRGQETWLANAVLVRKRYRVYRESWEHDHCEFCWAKFMDPDYSVEHREAVERDPEVQTEGYTTTVEHAHGADYHWVCASCFADFHERFSFRVADAARE